jgi:hypothetical protein
VCFTTNSNLGAHFGADNFMGKQKELNSEPNLKENKRRKNMQPAQSPNIN